MIKLVMGDQGKVEYFPKAASTAFPNGALVQANGSGQVIPATATSEVHIGVTITEVPSTATLDKIPVMLVTAEDSLIADVPGGGLTLAHVLKYCDLTSTGDGIVPTASVKGSVLITGYISPYKALIKINSMAGTKDV